MFDISELPSEGVIDVGSRSYLKRIELWAKQELEKEQEKWYCVCLKLVLLKCKHAREFHSDTPTSHGKNQILLLTIFYTYLQNYTVRVLDHTYFICIKHFFLPKRNLTISDLDCQIHLWKDEGKAPQSKGDTVDCNEKVVFYELFFWIIFHLPYLHLLKTIFKNSHRIQKYKPLRLYSIKKKSFCFKISKIEGDTQGGK